MQRFHIFVHGSFTKPCVRSVDKPRELLCTPAFLAVEAHVVIMHFTGYKYSVYYIPLNNELNQRRYGKGVCT